MKIATTLLVVGLLASFAGVLAMMQAKPAAPIQAVPDAGSLGVTCLASIDVNGAFWQQCNDDNGNILWRDIDGRTYAECPPVICTEAAQ